MPPTNLITTDLFAYSCSRKVGGEIVLLPHIVTHMHILLGSSLGAVTGHLLLVINY